MFGAEVAGKDAATVPGFNNFMIEHVEEKVSINTCDNMVLSGKLMYTKMEGSDTKPEWGVVISHPHPKLGGNQRNAVTGFVAQMLAKSGYMTLTFDTRGWSNENKCSHSWKGDAEREDFKAACAHLAAYDHIKRVFFIGYSFGAAVGCGVVHSVPGVNGMVSISYPCGRASRLLLGHHIALLDTTLPCLFITGSADGFTGVNQHNDMLNQANLPNKTVEVVQGATHFWQMCFQELGDKIMHWLMVQNKKLDSLTSTDEEAKQSPNL